MYHGYDEREGTHTGNKEGTQAQSLVNGLLILYKQAFDLLSISLRSCLINTPTKAVVHYNEIIITFTCVVVTEVV